MAPSSYAILNGTHVLATPSGPTTSETITNIVFGLCALTVGGIMIWQRRNAWQLWMRFYVSWASAEESLPDLSHELEVKHLESDMPAEVGLDAAGPAASNASSTATTPRDGNTMPVELDSLALA